MKMKKIEIIVVDDHEIIRDGVKVILSITGNIDVIGEAGNGIELFSILKYKQPDIILLDIIMPGMNGIEVAKKLNSDFPDIKVIILTVEVSEDNVFNAIDAGVVGFLPKDARKNELQKAIEAVYGGEEYFDNNISQIVLKRYMHDSKLNRTHNKKAQLTKREKEISILITDGLTHKEIAGKLFISKRTVDGHVNNIMEKFKFKSKADVIKHAIKSGLVKL